jgi:hypothetical protein
MACTLEHAFTLAHTEVTVCCRSAYAQSQLNCACRAGHSVPNTRTRTHIHSHSHTHSHTHYNHTHRDACVLQGCVGSVPAHLSLWGWPQCAKHGTQAHHVGSPIAVIEVGLSLIQCMTPVCVYVCVYARACVSCLGVRVSQCMGLLRRICCRHDRGIKMHNCVTHV